MCIKKNTYVVVVVVIGYYLKQNNLFQRIKKQKWEEEDVKKKFVFEKRIHQVQKMPVHTHTKAWVHAVGMHETEKKKQVRQRGVTRHLKRAKKDKLILGF